MGLIDQLEKEKKRWQTQIATSKPVQKLVNSRAAQNFTNSRLARTAEGLTSRADQFARGIVNEGVDWAGGQLGRALGDSMAAREEARVNQRIQNQQAEQDKIIMGQVRQARQAGNEKEAQRLLGVMNNPAFKVNTDYKATVDRYKQGQRDAVIGGAKTALTAVTLPSTLSGQSAIAGVAKGTGTLTKAGLSAKSLAGATSGAGIGALGDVISQKLTTGKIDWNQAGRRAGESLALEGVTRPIYNQTGQIAGRLMSGKAGKALAKIGQTATPKLSELVARGAARGALSGALAVPVTSAIHTGLQTLQKADFDPSKSAGDNAKNVGSTFARDYLKDLPGQAISGATTGGIFGAIGGFGDYKRAQEAIAANAKAGKPNPADLAQMRQQALATLGVDENATPADLEKIHKQLVLKTHPDRNGGDDTAFKQVQEAYEFLTQGKPMASTYTSIYEPQNRTNQTSNLSPNQYANNLPLQAPRAKAQTDPSAWDSITTSRGDKVSGHSIASREQLTPIVEDIHNRAVQYQGEMVKSTRQALKDIPGVLQVIDPGAKTLESSLNKAYRAYLNESEISNQYNLAHIGDNARQTVIVDNWDKALQVSQKLRQIFPGMQARLSIDKPTHFDTGYRAIHLMQRVNNGVTAETQIHTPESWALKLESDAIHEKWRDVAKTDATYSQRQAEMDAMKAKFDNYYAGITPEVMRAASASSINTESSKTPNTPVNENHDLVAGLNSNMSEPVSQNNRLAGFNKNLRITDSFQTLNNGNTGIISPPGQNVNSQNVNNNKITSQIDDNNGNPVDVYTSIPEGWQVVRDTKFAPAGYVAITNGQTGKNFRKGVIKDAVRISQPETITIANHGQSRTSEVMDALTGGQSNTAIPEPGKSDEEWESILNQARQNSTSKSTAADVLDPINIDDTEIPDPGDDPQTKLDNLQYYIDNNPRDKNLFERAKVEISQALDPLKTLSPQDKQAFDTWRARELAAVTKAQYLAREWAEKFGNPDDETAWKITQYIQNPTRQEAKELGLEHPEQYDEAIKELRAWFQDLYEQQKLRTSEKFGWQSNYIPQKWSSSKNDVRKVEDELLKQSGKVRQQHHEHRIIPDYKTGVAYGLKPKYTHFAPLIGEYYVRAQRAIDNYELQNDLMARGLLKTGENETKLWRLVTADSIPSGDKKLYAPQAIAKTLDNIWGKGAEGSAVLGTTAKLNSSLQNIALSGGVPGTPMNSFVYGQVIKELAGGNVAAVKNFFESFDKNSTEQFMSDHRQTIEAMNKQGIRIDPGWDYTSEYRNILAGPLEEIVQADGKLEKLLVSLDMTTDKLDEWFGEATFKQFMPRLNVGLFEAARQEALNLGKTDEQANQFAAQTLKNWRGLVDPYARPKKIQQFIDSVFFAPQYRESMINFWTNLLKTAASGQLGRPENRRLRNFLLGTAIYYGLMNVANFATAGHATWDNKVGKWLSWEIPEYDLQGNPTGRSVFVPLLPSVSTLVRNAWEFGGACLAGDGETMRRLAAGYFGMGIKLPLEIIGNQDFYGNPIRDTSAPVSTQLGQIASYIAGDYSHPYVGAAINYATGRKNGLETAAQVLELPAYGSRSTETANLSKQEFENYQQLAKSGQDASTYAQSVTNAKALKQKQKQVAEQARQQTNTQNDQTTTNSNADTRSWWERLWNKQAVELSDDERRQIIKSRIGADDRTISNDDLNFYYLGDLMDLPNDSRLQQAQRRDALFKKYDKLEDDNYLDASQKRYLQDQILRETGMSGEQMAYYQKASASNNNLKYLTILDDLDARGIVNDTPEGHERLLNYLVTARQSVGGKILAADGVITTLQEKGFISSSEAKLLKSLDWDEEVNDWKNASANTTSRKSSSGSSSRLKQTSTNPGVKLAASLRDISTKPTTTKAASFTISAPKIGELDLHPIKIAGTQPSLRISAPAINPEEIVRIAGG